MNPTRAGRAPRRHAVATVLACLGFAAAWASRPAAAVGPPPTVTVEDRSSFSEVQGRFDAPVPLSVAWGVLTDYDHIADFVSSMRTSAVESRLNSDLTVRQEAVLGSFPFRQVAHLLLSVREQPDSSIQFHDTLDRDFRLYRGEWELRPGSSGTSVTYRLHARPVGAIPPFISHAVLRRTASQLLSQVQAEMMRRAETPDDP